MGYDSKLFIMETNLFHKLNEKNYASFIASYDLGVFPSISSYMRNCPKAEYYFYMDDGNTPVYKDLYDQELTQCSIEEIISILENEKLGNNWNYRRIDPLLVMLKTLKNQEKEGRWRKLIVLHFGH